MRSGPTVKTPLPVYSDAPALVIRNESVTLVAAAPSTGFDMDKAVGGFKLLENELAT